MRRRRPHRRFAHHGTRRGAEHRAERDEMVEHNLEPHLVPLWRETRGQFRGSPHRRYEQFMEFVHDVGTGEGMGVLQDEADRKLEAMIREHDREVPPPCTSACMGASGGHCTCGQCRGANHGVAA